METRTDSQKLGAMLTYNKIKDWITEYWQILAAFLGLIFGALAMHLRSKEQKEVLENANESHKKEIKAIRESEERLVTGIEEINQKEQKDLEEASKENIENTKQIQKKKEDFVEKAATDDDLAEKIANKLGVDFVE